MSQFDTSIIAELVDRLGPSVVRIDAGHRFSGSGTVWADGVIVTAHHVLEREEGVEIGTASGTLAATVAGTDPGTGLAVLKVQGGPHAVTTRPLEGLRVGDFVVALGRPGKSVRATFGIASTIGEAFRTPMGGHVEHYVEPDLSVPPGYSGGPLLDLQGRVIGLNHRGLVQRAQVTLPTATVDRVVGEILAHGRVRKGHLGVGVHGVKLPDSVAAATGQAHGVLVHAIERGSNAEKAGVLQGDVIFAVDGASVSTPWELATTLGGKVDVEVKLKLVRAATVVEITSRT